MATRKATTKGLVKGTKAGKEIALPVDVQARLAELAQKAIATEAGTGIEANFIRVDNHRFSRGEGEDLGEAIEAIVIDSVIVNKYFDAPYVEGVQSAPACAAIGRDLETMKPYDNAPAKGAESCAACPLNEYESAANGRGKACANRRRLIVMLMQDIEKVGYKEAPLYTLELSPTALRPWARYVRAIQRQHGVPPIACITAFACDPNEKFSTVLPSFGSVLNGSHIAQVLARHAEAKELAEAPVVFEGYTPPNNNRGRKVGGKATPKGKAAPKARAATKTARRAR